MPKRERDNASTHGRVLSGPTTNISHKIHATDQRLVSHYKRARLDGETTSMPGCKRSDLLLSTNYSKRPVAGSQHVISLDNLDFEEITSQSILLNRPQPYNVYVPMDLAQFQCDVYDARDHTELALALAQICIIKYLPPGQGVEVYSPDNRCCCTKEQKLTKPQAADSIVLRRNVIVIDENNALGAVSNEEKAKTVKALFTDVKNSPHMTFTCITGQFDVETVMKLCNQLPQCTILDQTMEAPIVSYAGVAMTDAFYNASNGDTFVTSNLYSLMTTQNGPVPSCHGDPLHWIWHAEQNYYNKHGCRVARNLWYREPNNALDTYDQFDHLEFEKNNYRDGAAESRIGPKFHFIPFKMGYDDGSANNAAPRYGLLDSMNQRKVGVAQSNAGAYASIDITNCGKCIN